MWIVLCLGVSVWRVNLHACEADDQQAYSLVPLQVVILRV